ncbi:uncharacterized protein, partial [Temnothorax longispinosus]|uniref:uncharacterized protein n=1 Tax=Temnothorax longispinosus TaxID=300112 RepID=UPI003A9970E5
MAAVVFARTALPQAVWKFISGKENPADLATRGLTPQQLLNSRSWWIGPYWLTQHPSTWADESYSLSSDENLEERPVRVATTIESKSPKIWDLIEKYSDLTKLLRITARCKRVVRRFHGVKEFSFNHPLTVTELTEARLFWIRIVQQAYFSHELGILASELVTDYTTEAFLAAYKRFTSRRGICSTLSSDCGTNFKGADADLRKLFLASSKELEELAKLLARDGTQWKFNPPAAPHFGGKWEAGVKSVKTHLNKIVGDQLLTYEEMNTLLIQIEAVLNSRPLCPQSEDPTDISALSPGHFLIGQALTTIPEPSLDGVKVSHLSRWQLLRKMLEDFWKQWSRDCLQRYLAVYKWNNAVPSIKEGSLVLVVDERYPPAKWPLGRVVKTHPGQDGHTRVVT